MIEEPAVFVISNNRDRTFPKRRARRNRIVNLHQELLAVADPRGSVVVCATSQVGTIAIRRLDKNDFGPLIWRGVGHVRLKLAERAEVVAQQNARNPVQHHGEEGNALVVNTPAYLIGIQPVVNKVLWWER